MTVAKVACSVGVWCLLVFASLTGCGHAGADLTTCGVLRPLLPSRKVELRGGGETDDNTVVAPEAAVARQIEAAKDASLRTASACWSDIWLEHAIARCESDYRPLAPQISRASPFLPLLVAPGGLETVTLLQRRMLLDQSFKTAKVRSSSSSPPSSSGVISAEHSQRPHEEAARASNSGVMGPEGIMALQVNDWEPLLENVTHDEQRLFVHKLTSVAKDDDKGRHDVLLQFSGRLGRVVIEEWESYLHNMMLAVLSREAPEFLARAEQEEGYGGQVATERASDVERQEDGLPEEVALVHNICSSVLNFCEETSARLPPEATQRYMHVEMATMGWETLVALLQSTPVGQKLPDSDTVPALVPGFGIQYPNSHQIEAKCGAVGCEEELMHADGKESGRQTAAGTAVFRSAEVAVAFAAIHQALGDCYWQRRAGERFEFPFTARNLEQNLDAALMHYLRAGRVYAALQQQGGPSDLPSIADSPNLGPNGVRLAQSYLGAATVLAAKRLHCHWSTLEELTALSACETAHFRLPSRRGAVKGSDDGGRDEERVEDRREAEHVSRNVSSRALDDNLEVAVSLLGSAVQLLEGAMPEAASGVSCNAVPVPSPDWVHAQVQLAVCLSRRALHSAAGDRIQLVTDRCVCAGSVCARGGREMADGLSQRSGGSTKVERREGTPHGRSVVSRRGGSARQPRVCAARRLVSPSWFGFDIPRISLTFMGCALPSWPPSPRPAPACTTSAPPRSLAAAGQTLNPHKEGYLRSLLDLPGLKTKNQGK